MGSPDNERDRSENEGPRHEVTISDRFAVMEAEVTRDQFAAFVKEAEYATEGGCYYWDGTRAQLDPQRSWQNPGFEQTDQHPVVCVNWNDAQAYAKWLSQKTGRRYRLPSEAEWEYVARAGTQTRFWFGDKDEDLCTYGNVGDRSTKAGWKEWDKNWRNAECNDGHIFTAPVKSFKPNAYGLYDVNGNAWEWTRIAGMTTTKVRRVMVVPGRAIVLLRIAGSCAAVAGTAILRLRVRPIGSGARWGTVSTLPVFALPGPLRL
jgi:formylglycine-generating enzyme required for sulfatase activity